MCGRQCCTGPSHAQVNRLHRSTVSTTVLGQADPPKSRSTSQDQKEKKTNPSPHLIEEGEEGVPGLVHHHDHRHADGRQLLQGPDDVQRRGGVQARGGLVQHEDGGPRRQLQTSDGRHSARPAGALKRTGKTRTKQKTTDKCCPWVWWLESLEGTTPILMILFRNWGL